MMNQSTTKLDKLLKVKQVDITEGMQEKKDDVFKWNLVLTYFVFRSTDDNC